MFLHDCTLYRSFERGKDGRARQQRRERGESAQRVSPSLVLSGTVRNPRRACILINFAAQPFMEKSIHREIIYITANANRQTRPRHPPNRSFNWTLILIYGLHSFELLVLFPKKMAQRGNSSRGSLIFILQFINYNGIKKK